MINKYKRKILNKIPKDWEIITLKNLFTFKNGVNSDGVNYGKGIKFINVLEIINNNSINYNNIPGSVSLDEKKISLYLVKKGDVLFNRTSETQNEIGLSAVYLDDKEVVFGGFVIRARPKNDKLDLKFKKYMFSSTTVRKDIVKRGQGGIRYNIGQQDLCKVKLPLPPLPEQRNIAEILSTWDDAIEKLENLLDKKGLLKKGLIQRLLTGEKRLPGYSESIKYKNLQPYIYEVSKRNFDNKVNKVLSVTNTRGFIEQSEQFERIVASKDVSNYKIVEKGQFAYNPSRINVGSIDLLKDYDKGILSPMYIVFQTYKNLMYSNYLYYLLKSYWFLGHIPQYVQGSVRDSLSFDGLCAMKFFIPSIPEQKKIASVLSTIDSEIELFEKRLELLNSQKKGLMQKLLTGKIRVKGSVKSVMKEYET
ncbi:restriction endonuclease subunit S [Candidatus Dependentiae bacterium]|nr:restriction endonuclease subunit S [Candidatus Dependentiae bacterium]